MSGLIFGSMYDIQKTHLHILFSINACVLLLIMVVLFFYRTVGTMKMFVRSLSLFSWQVTLGCKWLAVQRSLSRIVGQNCKFIGQKTSVKLKCQLIRPFSLSSSVCDIKQLPSEAVCSDDVTSPAYILANLTPDDEKRLKVLKLEYDVFFSTGIRVPDYVSDASWVHLLWKCPTPSSRQSYYRYLFKTEKADEGQRRKREANRLAAEEKRKVIEQKKLDGTYEFINRIYLITREPTMNRWYENNLCYALMNGPNLVFDFSFEDQMSEREIKNLVRQVKPS